MNIQAVIVGAGCAMLVSIFMLLCRAFIGPTVFDRILAMNAMGTKAVIFLSLLGFIVQRPEFLDTALTYALINFVGTIAILKYVDYKRIG